MVVNSMNQTQFDAIYNYYPKPEKPENKTSDTEEEVISDKDKNYFRPNVTNSTNGDSNQNNTKNETI